MQNQTEKSDAETEKLPPPHPDSNLSFPPFPDIPTAWELPDFDNHLPQPQGREDETEYQRLTTTESTAIPLTTATDLQTSTTTTELQTTTALCFYFLTLYIGVKEMTHKLILRQSLGDLKRSWTGNLTMTFKLILSKLLV